MTEEQLKTVIINAHMAGQYNAGIDASYYEALVYYEIITIPKEVRQAEKYIKQCDSDLGFMGSPEYDKQKKIVDDYYKPILQKQKEEKEKKEYLRLKQKYDS